MNGARMRSYSLAGTRPARTRRSVPRLIAPKRARTRTSPGLDAAIFSSRNSARPGPTYQRALPCIFDIFPGWPAGCPLPFGHDNTVVRRVPEHPPVRMMNAPEDGLDLKARRYTLAQKDTQSPVMLEPSSRDEFMIAALPAVPAWRPALFFLSVGLTIVGLVSIAAIALSPGGLGPLDFILLALFVVTLPWYVIGFWNATIGLLIMRFARDPVAAVTPVAGRVRGDEPITASTAILLCIRNEPPERVARLLQPMMEVLAARGVGARFHVYVLSDTSRPEIAAAERARFAALETAWNGRITLTYRLRADNVGFKAGNIADFCERWGKDHDFAVMLDADSVMSVDLLLKLVRIMQIDPRLGILQSLVIGMPSASAFARIFQFGMRLGMRSYTIGSAWWQGDCGPYWGHNAAVRLKPFIAHCHIPPLPEGGPLGGHVLSHDQVEAVLMRRAGYEVRVLPEEDLGWEENPPTLIEFIRRDLRWCQGTLQYWSFLFLPGVPLVSRYQLAFAVLMFLGSPAWMGLVVVATAALALAESPAQFIRADYGMILFAV